MKKTVTLFTLLLLALTIQTAAAQQCPTIEKLTAKAADQLLPAHLLEGKAGTYYATLYSDLSDVQKNNCLLTRGRFAVLPSLAADDPLASVLNEDWVNEAWVNSLNIEVFYNGNTESQFVISEWDGSTSSWIPAQRQTAVSRDGNGFITDSIFETWSGSEWIGEQRILNEWDDMGNQLRFVGQELENGVWTTLFVAETVITSESIVTTSQAVNDDGMLENATRETIDLDDQGRESTLLFEVYDADMSAWEGLSRETKTYQDNTVTETSQLADGMGGWLDFDQTVYTLNDAGLPIEAIVSSLFFGTPDPSERTLSTYNDMDMLIEELNQSPDGAGGWVTDFAYFATYDNDGDLIEELYQEEDGTGKVAALINDERDTYTYGPRTVSVENELDTFAAFDIYPSPARDRVQVEVTLEQPAALAVDVFDVLGRRVHQMADEQAAAGTQQFAWEPGDMPAGMYFIRITLDERAETRPLMLMK